LWLLGSALFAFATGETPIRMGGTNSDGVGWVSNALLFFDGTRATTTNKVSVEATRINVATNLYVNGTSTFNGTTTHSTGLILPVASSVGNTAGSIGVDSTDGQLQFHNGQALKAISPTSSYSLLIIAPADADDNFPFWFPPYDLTVLEMYCITDVGTTTITISDGTNAMVAMLCNPNGTTSPASLSNNTFTRRERMEYDTSNTTGTPAYVDFVIDFKTTVK